MDENNFHHGYGNYFENYLISAVFKIPNNYEAHWQRHLKDTLQLKILRTWTNIHVNSLLNKNHETEMGYGALEIISCTKIRACSLKNMAPRHFTYCCILLFLWNKPSFQIQPGFDWIIFTTIFLPFYLLILQVHLVPPHFKIR